MELIIGSHVSYNKDNQLLGSVKEAISYGETAFMFYTGAPQNTNRSKIDENLIKDAKKLMEENCIKLENVVVHAPYIINLANPKNFDFNIRFLKEEINRVESFGVTKLVLHPGSHVGLGTNEGIKNIIDALNFCLSKENNVTICLETMAGKGTEIGRTFEEIKTIIDGVDSKEKIGVCIDTCHLNDSGYDLNNFDEVLKEFDKVIGLDYLKVVHINDSKNELGSNKDRHENIGFGKIGFDNLIKVIYNDKLKKVPKILETPYVNGFPPYKEEIQMIKKQIFDSSVLDKLK